MGEASETKAGVWASLNRSLDALLATVQNWIELIAVEWKEAKCRVVAVMVRAAVVAAWLPSMMKASL